MDLAYRLIEEWAAIEVDAGMLWTPDNTREVWIALAQIAHQRHIRRIIIDATQASYHYSFLEVDKLPELWLSLGLDKQFKIAALIAPSASSEVREIHRHLDNRAQTLGIMRKHFLNRAAMQRWLLAAP